MDRNMYLKPVGERTDIFIYDENTNSKQIYPQVMISSKNALTAIQYVGKWW